MKKVQKILMLSALWCLLSASLGAQAVIETYAFSSPDLEARYHLLSQELRCPKCQNQNIADSNAPIARDLRVVLFEQLEAGATDDEILAFMVARYGEFVRYRPGIDRQTLLLWAAPALLLSVGTAGLIGHFRQRRVRRPEVLTDVERDQVEQLLREPRA